MLLNITLILIAIVIILLFYIYFNNKSYSISIDKEKEIKKDIENEIKELGIKETKLKNDIKDIEIEEQKIRVQSLEESQRFKDEVLEEAEEFKIKTLEKANKEVASSIEKIITEKDELIKYEIDEREDNFKITKELINEELDEVFQTLKNLEAKENSAILARIRAYEEIEKENFYCIDIESNDLKEMNEINEVIKTFRTIIPFKKAIFEHYLRKPIKDLVNRITKGHKISGIYKITHLETGKCYIGKSVDIGNRWLQHCRRGFGVEALTNNKLYPEMLKHGIYNFKYEIVEEVENQNLSEREKYWAQYFGAKIFGYTMKA